MAISVRNEGAKVNSNINVTPMVDVMLVLLIIFMVITPMLQHDVSVDLAQVNSPQQMKDADKEDALVVAINQATGEVKYFVTNATREPLRRVLAVAFRRATVEHSFRVGKQEAGLMHYEGRQYAGLMRHLILALIVMGFVSIHTDRLRGGKSTGDDGASLPGAEREVCGLAAPAAGDGRGQSHRRGDPVSPVAQRAGRALPQEAAA